MSLGGATGSVAQEGAHRSRYGIDKLKEGNYPVWKWNCQALLEENEVWEIVTGQSTRPIHVKVDDEEPIRDDVKEWETLDRKARRIIGFTVEDELQGPVREARSARKHGTSSKRYTPRTIANANSLLPVNSSLAKCHPVRRSRITSANSRPSSKHSEPPENLSTTWTSSLSIYSVSQKIIKRSR